MSEETIEELRAAVRVLQDREAIRECLTRYCRGVDRFDRDLLLSAFHPDAIDEHGKFVGGPEDFADWAIGQHARAHLSHQHCIFNHRCDLDGDIAHAETYFMFVAMNRRGKPVTLGGGRYVDRFERREGEWRIAARICLRDWSTLDAIPDMDDLSAMTSTSALLSEEERAFMNAGRGPARGPADPSYERPLTLDAGRADAYRRTIGRPAL